MSILDLHLKGAKRLKGIICIPAWSCWNTAQVLWFTISICLILYSAIGLQLIQKTTDTSSFPIPLAIKLHLIAQFYFLAL